MLILCRDEMIKRAASDSVAEYSEASEPKEDKQKRDAVLLTAYSADLDTVPTIEQIDAALGSVMVNTKEERQKVKDMRTWRNIISQS